MKYRVLTNCAFFLVYALVVFPWFVGCNQGGSGGIPTEYVEGTVLLNGTPIDTAQVRFTPRDSQNGMPASGYTDKSGMFKLTATKGNPGRGALAGEYIVTVTKIGWITEKKMVEGREQDVPVRETSLIPQVYASEETTPLKATVEPGKNTFQFNLEGTL